MLCAKQLISGPLRMGLAPMKIFWVTQEGGMVKNLYTKSERLTLSCRVTSAWPEKVTVYNQPIIILSRKKERKKTCYLGGSQVPF
jgi:hypothetical protein